MWKRTAKMDVLDSTQKIKWLAKEETRLLPQILLKVKKTQDIIELVLNWMANQQNQYKVLISKQK